MRTKKELIDSWIKKAAKDLLTVEHELSFPDAVTESICFHCQQATEKLLKAYLVFLGIPFTNTTLSIGVASFSLRFYLYAGATFLAQAKACYSIL